MRIRSRRKRIACNRLRDPGLWLLFLKDRSMLGWLPGGLRGWGGPQDSEVSGVLGRAELHREEEGKEEEGAPTGRPGL